MRSGIIMNARHQFSACFLCQVSRTFPTQQQLYSAVDEIARSIAAKSPLAVVGTKAILLHKRDHSVSDSLDYVATWNSATLNSTDLKEAMQARLEKRLPSYSKL
ncbi:delta(3,5), delta(2,4)-dienoyl-CoA isomerase [Klebsormidium nitens]|uniref:Delta(3,5), delta(2,4)-dienoyl-CoA isomerase n=1 Tax=Klebsormidium nitens TaxID=105231 RepID=A0A1Y1HID8_KLENI|nr:delta(3,5), delta(2,4)-dienoyl-CoA isomerase [Klebsormidium nitens]|eukprot:GAQ78244.1 delta(3,5), delta(2,4)-dienoyl-CoA isomerase [Klebsormidium nitens]